MSAQNDNHEHSDDPGIETGAPAGTFRVVLVASLLLGAFAVAAA